MTGFLLLILGMIVVSFIASAITRFWLVRRFRQEPASHFCSTERPTNPMIRKLIHEIRNPLNSMSLHLQLLAEDLDFPTSSDHIHELTRVQQVLNEIQRLNLLLTAFQRYANLPNLKFEVCNLEQVLQDLVDFNAPESSQQAIEVNCQIQNLPLIALDVNQIKQAILNLFLNANQSMPKGGKLSLRAKLLDEQVEIEIEDTGTGIAPSYKDKIFDLFFSTKHDGTGIGLAIAKQIIEGHGGRLEVQSQLHQGTKVIIHLPTNLGVNL